MTSTDITSNNITTLRSIEYTLEVLKYYNDGMDFNHLLDCGVSVARPWLAYNFVETVNGFFHGRLLNLTSLAVKVAVIGASPASPPEVVDA
jgi:hypothetical protein